MKSVFVLAFVTFIALCGGLTAPACVCDRRECEYISEIDCPGLGVVVWDPCNFQSHLRNYPLLLPFFSPEMSIFDLDSPQLPSVLYWISSKIYDRACNDTYGGKMPGAKHVKMIVLTKRPPAKQIAFRSSRR
ncbi:hypothetical protein QE152_g22854 [Popillia japonica]|uniref:Uncharacterized protein n=1 Tax=Popillia japonica TaxID=7064 RepID=A0AAW1KKQ3_POPJA